ncbi:MAG: site-2 protease family protein [Candidatus Pacebacteria bacterium]|nr:site-2 protease family protein [Candidatus Paceibacterota bacterium]
MEFIFIIIILIYSVVIHEVSHGAVANYLGDPTAKYAGRLTLNPIKHLDPIGSVILPIFLVIANQVLGGGIIFGWAKPVPVNPYNLRDQKYGSLKVALAGPGSNLLIALFFGLILRFFNFSIANSALGLIFSYIVYINILLAVFNLMPIPPLDGSHILFSFLSPTSAYKIQAFLSSISIFLLFIIIFFLFPWLSYVIDLIFRLITGFGIL